MIEIERQTPQLMRKLETGENIGYEVSKRKQSVKNTFQGLNRPKSSFLDGISDMESL